jgi:hypothetical protein
MFPKIGEYCTLDVVKEVPFGFYLDGGPMGEILLPTNEVVEEVEVKVDEEVEVFIYNDNENRVIATTRKPLAIPGTFGYMQCKDVNEFGAFLDWGLMKQLFVPFIEQQKRMEVGLHYVVYVYLDEETERLVASARINRFVGKTEIKTKKNEPIDILVTKKTDLGYKVIVNNAIWGLIFRSDAYRPLRIGQKTTGFVKTIREDGKVDVILRKAGLEGLNDAAEIILEKLEKADNKTLFLTDGSDPEAIRLTLNMSKKMFKKGVGMLYKNSLIELEIDRIILKE